MKEYTLIDLETFRAVVDSGSFNRAAERMGTSSASASRRISSLEEALGTRLLNRTTRQLSLTEQGQQYYDDINNILGELAAAEERLCAGEVEIRGTIRLAAPMSIGVQSIAPLLPDFLHQYPDVKVDLQLEDKQTDLYSGGIDLTLRIGRLEDSSLIATRLCDIAFGYFASPGYLKQRGAPSSADQLLEHDCLHYTLVNRNDEWPLKNRVQMQAPPLSANNGEVLREAAVRGLGITALPYFIVEESVATGELVPVLDSLAPKTMGLYAVRLSRKFTPLRIKVLIDYLKQRLQIK